MDSALLHLSSNDPVMDDLIKRYPRPSYARHSDYYQELVESIISQQLSVKAAATILERFKKLFGTTFPTPREIIAVDSDTLRSVGLSRQKVTYIQDLAAKVLDGSIDFHDIDLRTNEEIIALLTSVKGVGEWTAHMFLMFCMARQDVLAYGDLGIRNGITTLYALPTTATPDDVREIARIHMWQPYESIACWYVWRSLENAP